MTRNDDDAALLDALERLAEQHGTFRLSTTRRILHLGDRIVVIERVLVESITDRARIREEVSQLRLWFFFLLASVGSLVFVFVLAIIFGGA